MRSHPALSTLLRRALPGLLCASTLVACERGNDLERFSGRSLQVSIRDPSGAFLGVLDRKLPESGCLQLHPDVEATFDGVPLKVFPGSPIEDRDYCSELDSPPAFVGTLSPELFFGEPRNAVMEIRDGDQRMIAEFLNFFGRHAFALPETPPIVKPGEEVFLAWDPPTDDLSEIDEVILKETIVPARPEAGGVRFTIPADFPSGTVRVNVRGSAIPAVRCEGVAQCTAWSLLLWDNRSTPVTIQP